MSRAKFRAFQTGRPDHERWELVAGTPRMIVTTIVHDFITSRLESQPVKALMEHAPTRIACQHPGIELGISGNDCPEPDVAVFDADFAPGQQFTADAISWPRSCQTATLRLFLGPARDG